jgi:hypothetical protein
MAFLGSGQVSFTFLGFHTGRKLGAPAGSAGGSALACGLARSDCAGMGWASRRGGWADDGAGPASLGGPACLLPPIPLPAIPLPAIPLPAIPLPAIPLPPFLLAPFPLMVPLGLPAADWPAEPAELIPPAETSGLLATGRSTGAEGAGAAT